MDNSVYTLMHSHRFYTSGKNTSENQSRESEEGCGDSSSLEETALVLDTTRNDSIDKPIYLPQNKNLLTNPTGRTHPLLDQKRLHLATWLMSGVLYKNKEFLKQQQISFIHHGGRLQRNPTHLPGIDGVAGVMRELQIPFQQL